MSNCFPGVLAGLSTGGHNLVLFVRFLRLTKSDAEKCCGSRGCSVLMPCLDIGAVSPVVESRHVLSSSCHEIQFRDTS
jgi:hypothetical protein